MSIAYGAFVTKPARFSAQDAQSVRMPPIVHSTEPNRTAAVWSGAYAEILLVGTALLLALAAQWILSSTIRGTNYYGVDGKMVQSTILAAFKFTGFFDVTALSPIQGVGSQLLPKNVWANPSFWPFAYLDKEMATDVSALIALACFAGAVYVMARCFDVAILPSILAAQACIALFAPALLVVYMPTNFCLTPGDAVVYAPYMVALGLLGSLDPGSWRRFWLISAAVSALLLYSIYCDPLWTMIAGIAWSVPFAVVTLFPFRRDAVLARSAVLASFAVLLLVSGVASYLYTISQYTARVQFAEALDRTRGPAYVSAMTYSPNMKYLYLACAGGWVLGLVLLRGRSRTLVVAATAAFAAWAIYSLVYLLLLNVKWVPPIPIYLEQCLIALYLTASIAGYWSGLHAAACLVRSAWTASMARLRRVFPPIGERKSSAWRLVAGAVGLLIVAILPARVISYALADARSKATTFYEPWPNEPELMQFLTERIALEPGEPFRGAVNFLTLDHDAGFTMAHAWSGGIPTVNEYSQLVTPEALYFIHVLLKADIRHQLNRFDPFFARGSYTPAYWSMLRMFGVRYTAERWAWPDPYNPGLRLTTFPYRPNEPDRPPGWWYIYELPDPNIGNFSPTDVLTAMSGAEIMEKLADPTFDPKKQVVLAEPLNQPLLPAREMRVSRVRGGLHVSGKSDETSLVVLPQQFSNCLRPHDARVRLVRANLMMAAVIFSGSIDTDIVFDYGMFSPACRRADLADMKRLQLKIALRAEHLNGTRLLPDWDEALARIRNAANAIR